MSISKNETNHLKRVKPLKEGMRIVEGYKKILLDYPDYLKDESNIGSGKAEMLFFPTTVENIAWVIEEALKNGKKLTMAGGRTGICGGSVPDNSWLVSIDRMKKILDISCSEEDNSKGEVFYITLEAGVRLNEISQKLNDRDFGILNGCTELLTKSKKGYFYPPDPTETTATIGGTAATNASGARTLKFGPTRNFIYGLDIILANGYLLSLKRGDVFSKDGYFYLKGYDIEIKIPVPQYKIPETKHSAGFYSSEPMDIIDLFIGSEGVLGIISSVTIMVIAEPEYIVSGMAFFNNEEDVVSFVEDSRTTITNVTCLEYFDRLAIKLLKQLRDEQGTVSEIPELPGSVMGVYFESFVENKEEVKDTLINWEEEIDKCSGLSDISIASLGSKDLNRFKVIRHSIPEMINRRISEIKRKAPPVHKVGTDMAVPDGYLLRMLSFYREKLDLSGIEYIIFGHIGNNHLHVNMIPENEAELRIAEGLYLDFAKKAVEFGGSVSGEHGIGKLKKKYLNVQFTSKEIGKMKTVKAVLDPEGILNPGDLFD